MDSNLSERSGIDGDAVGTVIPSLVFLCRTVVTNNLERYTPESFYICDVYEWEEIIQLRHSTTQPNKKRALGSHLGTNDLDGNGRLLPAISDKVLQQIEECNEHIADSAIADTLVWKDCVEYRFKRNVGLLRPPILFVPWPILVQHIQNQCQTLSSIIIDSAGDGKEVVSKLTVDAISEAIHVLQSTTWNVALLRDTGIGKIVKRLLKKLSGSKTGSSCITDNHLIILQKLLSGWMNLASTNNITGTYQWKESSSSTKKVASTTMSSTLDSEEEAIQSSDLQLLEKCLSWRQLYQVLERRKGVIQATQGKRMRDIRNQVEMNRPKLVKVRPTKKVEENRVNLFAGSASSSSGSNSKIAVLRNEARVQTGRLQIPGRGKKPSFGDAVAFAAVTKKGMAHKRKMIGGTIQHFNNGTKRMKIPSSLSATTGTTKACPSRQFASKYKSVPVVQNSNKKR